MSLIEMWYMNRRRLKKYALDIMYWSVDRRNIEPWVHEQNGRHIVKARVDEGVLTFTVHVRVLDGGMHAWKYRKYSVVNVMNDATPAVDGDIPIDDRHVIRMVRSGKYVFKK